jgi:hypothetical protein
MKKPMHDFRFIGGVYRDSPTNPTREGKPWILEWPAPMGLTYHETLAAAKGEARKHKFVAQRWTGCDRR